MPGTIARRHKIKASRGETVSTDVIVIGSGASGMVAALTAAEGGAKVVLLEKMNHVGGTSNFAQGIFAVESYMQRERYITYTRDQAFRSMMEYSHWRANPRLVRAFIDESAGTIEWLEKQGVEFVEPTANSPGGLPTWHVIKGPIQAKGAAMIKVLVARAREKGVDIRAATEAKKILMESDRVTGVMAEKDGKTERIGARAVIVASGGYANNREWIKKYSGLDLGVTLIPVGNHGKVGDGIRMAWEAGAAEEGMGIMLLWRVGPMGPGVPKIGHLECAAAQPDLWVSQRGERFCDESITYNDTFEGNAIARLKEGYSFTLFDEAAREHMVAHGIEKSVGNNYPVGTPLTDFDKELEEALEKGNPDVFRADSLKDLARKIGADPAILSATVDEYNRLCAISHDTLFAKEPKHLRPLKRPAFYALRAHTVSLGTIGGIKINQRMEAVDREEKAIPGLYAVGTDTGGLYGDSYDYKYSTGAAVGFAVNSGRIAGRNVLRYIGGG